MDQDISLHGKNLKKNGCIYCGSIADSREHIPSKGFLIKPYPENLSTIPSCKKCNNSFSYDEKYVVCFLEMLKSKIYLNYTMYSRTSERLLEDKELLNKLQNQIVTKDGTVYFDFDEHRIKRILGKLALGHAAFELDFVNFDDVKCSVWFEFCFLLNQDEIERFNRIERYPIAHEIGARSMYVIEDLNTGDSQMAAVWHVVQEGRYRYQVSCSDSGNPIVKIVLLEILYSEIKFG